MQDYITVFTPAGPIQVPIDQLSPEDLEVLGLTHVQAMNDKHTAALLAYENWDHLNLHQKDIILKNLLWYVLVKEGFL